MFFHEYPYTDFHEMNLDWILRRIKQLTKEMIDFEAVNTISYEGEWDITKGYARWSVVVDNGIGYIAIQPVPSGIALTNTDYWVDIAEFSTIIAGLGQRVVQAENDIDTLQNDLSDVAEEVAGKFSRLTSGTKIYCVGNSFVWGSGGAPVPPSGDRGWAYYMSQLTGCTYERMCQNGGDFLSRATSGATFPNKTYREALAEYVASKTQEQLDDFDYVIFGGGYNDHSEAFSNYTGLVSEIRTTIRYVKQHFRNAKVVLIPLMADTFKNNADQGIEKEYLAYMTAWTNASIQEGCLTCEDTYTWTFRRTAFGAGDNIHLNDDGYQRIARYMTAVIEGWDGKLFGYYAVTWNNVSATYELLTSSDGMAQLQAQLDCSGITLGSSEQLIGNISTASYLAPNILTHYFTGFLYNSSSAVQKFIPVACSISTSGNIYILKQDGIPSGYTRLYISTSWRQGI